MKEQVKVRVTFSVSFLLFQPSSSLWPYCPVLPLLSYYVLVIRGLDKLDQD